MDARALGSGGIGRYLEEILDRLVGDSRFSGVTLFGRPDRLRAYRGQAGVTIHPAHAGMYDPRLHVTWPIAAGREAGRHDVTFFPHYDAPLWSFPARSVVTVHDLTHFQLPESFPVAKRLAGSLMLQRVTRRAARIIVVSEATQRDLVRRLPDVDGRVRIVPNGVSGCFFPDAGPLPRWLGEGAFLLCVGNIKSHKNLVTAVDVLAQLRDRLPDVRLVLAGRRMEGWNAVVDRAREVGVADRVVGREGIGDEELRRLYSCCTAFLFPSLYEGFGLPVLEAMACGAPVIASNRAAVPEVVGDAGFCLPPTDSGSAADIVCRLVDEPVFRSEVVRRGRRRAAAFSWEDAAGRTIDILHAVSGGTAASADRASARRAK